MSTPSAHPPTEFPPETSREAAMRRTIVAAALTASALLTTVQAQASPEFHAACVAAHRNPYAPTGKLCRSKGWTVRHHIVVTPRKIVAYNTLPECKQEDGGPFPCFWDAQHRANGYGATYYVTNPNKDHYVWAGNPTGGLRRWRWLPRWLVQRLSDRHHPHNPFREHWGACVITADLTSNIRCPDGTWTTS